MKFSRTGELVLGVIGAVFTAISVILLTIAVSSGSAALEDPELMGQFEQEIVTEMQNDPTLTAQDVEMASQFFSEGLGAISVFGWAAVVVLVISLIFNILAIVFISKNRNPKLAGVFFILAGLFAFIISLTSILLYIAAIMSFVRKAPVNGQRQQHPDDLDYYEPNRPL